MINLKSFERQDFKTFISWFTSPEILIQACGKTFEYPVDETQLEKYIQGSESKPPLRKIFKAVDAENNKNIGNLTLERIDLKNQSSAIACVIIGDENYKGKGICELMIRWVVDKAFYEMGLRKFTLNVFDFNTPAIKCYEKAGFKIVDRIPMKYGDKDYINIKMELIK